MKKINICFHIMDISNCGGTEKVTLQIANKLANNPNYNIFILSNYNSNKTIFFDVNNKIKTFKFYKKRKRFKLHMIDYIVRTKKFINDNKIDLLITVDSFLGLIDIPAIKNTNCKSIIWEHFGCNRRGFSRLVKIAKELCIRTKTNIITISKRDYNNFKTKYPNMKAKLFQIYNPNPINKRKINYKNEFHNNTIISCGRLVPEKGYNYLLEVAHLLYKDNKNFKWIIVGDGELKKELDVKVKEYNLSKNVKFVGKKNDVGSYYEKSDIFVLTSKNEGFGIVLLEARYYNLPIISFDIDCGPDEIINDGINGFLVKPYDVNDMANKIKELISDKNKISIFKENSKIGFPEADYENVIKKWNELINEIVVKK